MAICPKCGESVADPYDCEGAGLVDGKPSVKAWWQCPSCGFEWKTVSPIPQDSEDRKVYAKMQLHDEAERLSNNLLQLAGVKSQTAETIYNNLAEILTATLEKIERKMTDKDQYPYTFELFTGELETRLSHWFDPKQE